MNVRGENMEKIKELLLKKEKGLVFLSAPTKSGKTKLVECISADRQNTRVVSGEEFMEALMQPLTSDGKTDLLDALEGYGCICIEDIDWYGGREQVEYRLADVLSSFADEKLIVVTGIRLKERMKAMFSRLEAFDCFEKENAEDSWL